MTSEDCMPTSVHCSLRCCLEQHVLQFHTPSHGALCDNSALSLCNLFVCQAHAVVCELRKLGLGEHSQDRCLSLALVCVHGNWWCLLDHCVEQNQRAPRSSLDRDCLPVFASRIHAGFEGIRFAQDPVKEARSRIARTLDSSPCRALVCRFCAASCARPRVLGLVA